MPGFFLRRLRYLFRRGAVEREMDDEMRLHIELEAAERVRQGMLPDEAYRTARVDFGGVERYKEEGRSARGVRPLEDLAQDVAYTARVLRKSPVFTTTSVLILGIGMAATTAVFSVANAILLRTLPVPEPRRLFVLAERWENGQSSTTTNLAQPMYPYSHYREVREATGGVFDGLAGYRYGSVAMRHGDGARSMSSLAVTANYFHTLRLRPALGRLFSDTLERADGAEEVVISHALWQAEFAGDSTLIGRPLFIDSRAAVIVGVAPEGFMGTMNGLLADLWLRSTDGLFTMFGRLTSGLSVPRARLALEVARGRLVPGEPWQRVTQLTLDPMVGVPVMSRGVASGFMGLLLVTAGIVLAIAASNVAGMLLARATHRRREIAIRLALGASRGRLVRQLLTESISLCILGGVVGLVMAWWLVTAMPAIQPPINVRTALEPKIDAMVLAVSFVVALFTGTAAGLAPALQSTRFDLLAGLRDARGPTRRRRRSRAAFVVAQLAMSIVLLSVAGLFVRAVERSQVMALGLDARGVVVAELDLGPHGYDRVRGWAFYDELTRRLAARPELVAVGLGIRTPLSLGHSGEILRAPDGRQVQLTYGIAGPGYLETVGIDLVAGRSFSDRDGSGAPAVIVVNETLARRFWPGATAVGQRLEFNGIREVIGVARDGKYRTPDEAPAAYAFVPFSQSYTPRMAVHARARLDEAVTLRAIREEVEALDANIALEKVGTLTGQLAIYSLPHRVAAACIGIFGLIGVVLAALGIHGVIAYHVAQQTREFSIRLALGATGGLIARSVLREGMVLVGMGLLVGVPASLAVGRLARSLLFGVPAGDPLTLAVVSAVLGIVALLAGSIPARRAARVDPMSALRAD
jgi:predicted permease